MNVLIKLSLTYFLDFDFPGFDPKSDPSAKTIFGFCPGRSNFVMFLPKLSDKEKTHENS
jgi:hypothetical protein